MKPIIKPYLRLRLLKDNKLLFGEGSINKHLEANDIILHFMSLLDGKHSIEEIFNELHRNYPEISKEEVEDSINKLLRENLIEENEKQKPDFLSDEELERYNRQLLFFSMFEKPDVDSYTFQQRLKNAHITLLGVGGVGSHTLLNLASAGVGSIRVVDFDKVEGSNLSRSFIYDYLDIGKSKVTVLEEKIKKLNPFSNYEMVNQQITSKDDIVQLLDGTDFAILSADTPYLKINKWFNEACLLKNIPYSLAGCSEFHGTVGPITIPFQTSCFECQEFDQTDLYSGPEFLVEINKNRKAAAFAPIISSLASLNSLEIIKYLTKITESSLLNRQLEINYNTLEFKYIERPKLKNCPVCSKKNNQEENIYG